jgi:diguanylate cyclase (GGDEF)-like protein
VDAFPSLADSRRLSELRQLAILDTPAEPDYGDLAALASAVVRSPVAAVNFVDAERHFTKAIIGMPEAQGGNVPNTASFCAATVAEPDGVLVVANTHADERWRSNPLVTGGPKVGFYAGVSIVSDGQRVGVVCAFGPEPREVQERERSALQTVARQAAAQLQLRRRNVGLRDLALTDPLTGLANRTLLFDRLEAAVAQRERSGAGVGLLFCDVDDFKEVNDRYGHDYGDRLLCDIADRLRDVAHDTDTVARIAGDEFVLVCPHLTSGADLDAVLHRVTVSLREGPSMPDGSPPPRLSIGAVLARDHERPVDILRRSDAAMYAVKGDR